MCNYKSESGERFLKLFPIRNKCEDNHWIVIQDGNRHISLIREKSDITQFLWVTIGPTYKLTTGKLSVQYARFTYVSIFSFWFNLE
jgi:hypothetical protein